jgi:rhodanese-related sulfurtransferase
MRYVILRTTLVIICSLLASPHALADDETVTAVEPISVTDAQSRVMTDEQAIILDVRTPAEFEMSHIPDALNANVQDEDFAAMLARLDPSRTYIVHCTKNPADGRSSRALQQMREQGFDRLLSLDGGYIAWKEAGLPLTEAAAETPDQ